MKLRLLFFLVLGNLMSVACTATDSAPVAAPQDSAQATLEVAPQSVMDYFDEISRITALKTSQGEYLLQHAWYQPHTRSIRVAAPQTYELSLLCEKPLRLRFEKPTTQISVEPGCLYVLSCDWSSDASRALVERRC